MIEETLKNLKGTLLGYGIEEKNLLLWIQNNEAIQECDLINSKTLEEGTGGFSKTVSMKQIKKKYKKKGVDYILINQANMTSLEKRLLPLFMKIVRKEIFVYDIMEMESIKKKYQRYAKKIKEDNQEKTLVVKKENIKIKPLMIPVYYMVDWIGEIIFFVSELLTS